MDYTFWLSCAALVLAAVAAARSYVPPQRRNVLELEGRVSDLEYAYSETAKRLTKRAGRENMEKAREAHEVRAARRNAIEEHAAAILQQQPAAPGPAQPSLSLDDPAQARAALRARLGLTH